jgi:hypothetical protein
VVVVENGLVIGAHEGFVGFDAAQRRHDVGSS